MTPAFWNGKKVFLTGHTGFKGSWLSLWLQSLGADVTGFALQPATNPNLFEVAKVAEGMTSIISDIRNQYSLQKAMQVAKPDVVIHMAAQALVRFSYAEPVETYATNVMGTVNVLESSRYVSSVKAILVVTTDKCYENREWLWGYREDEPLGGYDPYSSSKACAELVTSAYRRSFFKDNGVAVASARAGNVIGGGDWTSDRLVPDILRAFEANRPVIIRNPHSTRPWQHVLEPLSGYLTLAERLFSEGQAFAESWNFGPIDGETQTVKWIVEHMASIWGHAANWQQDDSITHHEANYLKLEISKARSRLDWRPVLRLQDALALVIDWSKQRQTGADMGKFTLAQIQAFQSLT